MIFSKHKPNKPKPARDAFAPSDGDLESRIAAIEAFLALTSRNELAERARDRCRRDESKSMMDRGASRALRDKRRAAIAARLDSFGIGERLMLDKEGAGIAKLASALAIPVKDTEHLLYVQKAIRTEHRAFHDNEPDYIPIETLINFIYRRENEHA